MKRKRYTKAFKRQLVALVAQGRTPEQLSREYEPTSQTIRDLKAENARLREEREILGKAASWFAMETTSNRKKGSSS